MVLPDPATPVRSDSFPPAASAVNGDSLLPREPNAGVANLDAVDRRARRLVGEIGRSVPGGGARFVHDRLLDAQLFAVAEPGLSFMDAKDQGDGIAVMDEATLPEQLRHRIDVVPPARRSGLDEATGGMHAQPLHVENGRRQKFGRERFRSQYVSPLVASGSCPLDGRRRGS